MVKLADEEFGEVTGIRTIDDGKSSVVEYTIHLTNLSPFTALLPRKLEKTTIAKKSQIQAI